MTGWKRRLGALLMVCCLLAAPAYALDPLLEEYGMDLDLFLTYLDMAGDEMSIYPAPAGWRGEEVLLWAYLPDSTVEEVTLHVSDVNGLYTFEPDEGTDLQVIDAGNTAQGEPLCRITAYAEDGEEIPIALYLSLSAPAPIPEAAVPQTPEPLPGEPVSVTLHYVDEEGHPIAPDQTETVWTGRLDAVYAPSFEGYTRVGDVSRTVQLPLGTTQTEDITFVYRAPEPTPVPADARVAVQYLDAAGTKLAEDTWLICPGGETTQVEAQPENLPENYVLTGSPVQEVTVDAEGAHPDTVTFYYVYAPEETPQPVRLIIRCQDEEGNILVPDREESHLSGETVSVFAPEDGPDPLLWVLAGEDMQEITVQDDGGSAQMAVFIYRPADTLKEAAVSLTEEPTPEETPVPTPTPTPARAPAVKIIQVFYTYDNDIYGYSSTRLEPISEGEAYLFAEEARPGYQLEGPGEQLVTVYPDGSAQPDTVTFHYVRIPEATQPPVMQTTMPVYYVTEDGNTVASTTLETVHTGEQVIYANPTGLQDGYDLITGPQTVVYDYDGTLTPDSLTFYYRRTAEAAPDQPDGRDEFALQPYSGYAQALRTVNMRSYPDQTDSSNIIGTITKDDLIVLKEITNYKDSTWYRVSVNGRIGYVSASVVKELSDEEADLISGMIPEQSEEEPLPDEDGLIELWGKTNTKVRFRDEPNGKTIRELRKNTDIFIESAQETEGVVWYSAVVNGQKGSIMAQYVDLMTASQSALKQSQLKSPVPTHTVQMTRVPTATPTMFIPTPAPTPTPELVTPEPTATPVPYAGYGVTTARAAVRGSLSLEDEAIREMIPIDSLINILGQTYVDGVCWDSVRVSSSGVVGFMEDAYLRRITSSEAEYYLEDLATPTPAPVILSTPIPFVGMARSLGDFVPLRSDMTANAMIIALMGKDAVMEVMNQETMPDGVTWCLAQYGAHIGYVRRDMIAEMNMLEAEEYRQTLRTPTPSPLPTDTPRPVSQRLTAYGTINRDKVNLRSQPDVTSISVYMMSRYELAYVLDTVIGQDEKTWYYVTVNGRSGYVRSDYLEIMSQYQLDSFLNTEEFRSVNNSDSVIYDSTSLQPYEDHLQNQWQSSVYTGTFEPFDPYETPGPVQTTPQPAATAAPTLPPTLAPTIVAGFATGLTQTAEDEGGGLSLGLILLIAGAVVILVGGTTIYMHGSRRRAQRHRAMQRAQQVQAVRRGRQAPDANAGRPVRNYRQDGVAPYGSTARPPMPQGVQDHSYEPERSVRPVRRVEEDPLSLTDSAAPEYGVEERPRRSSRAQAPAQGFYETAQDDTAMYRRPSAGRREDKMQVPPEANQPPDGGEAPAQGDAGQPVVRRRRSERYRYDDRDQ